jgi:hypothetical protein
MKSTHSILLLLVMGVAILFSSCKKAATTESTELGANSTGTFTATIGGTDWQATKVKAYVQDVFTRFSGSGTISDTSSKFSNVNVSVIIKYVKTPTVLELGEDVVGFTFDATATMDCTLRKTGAVVTYVGKYVPVDNFSILNITTYSSARIAGTVEFRSTLASPADTVDLRDGSFNITF